MRRRFLICILTCIFIYSCGGGPGGPVVTEPTGDLVARGWVQFQAANFDSAKALFRQAIAANVQDIADAYNGLGFSLAFQDSLQSAISNFNLANSNGLTFADAFVGLAASYRDFGNNFAQSVTSADAAIARDPSYVFRFNNRISIDDVYLIKAQSSFRRGESFFAVAQAAVNVLDSDNGLDPNNPNSWFVSNQQFNTYAEALLKEIEILEELIGGVF